MAHRTPRTTRPRTVPVPPEIRDYVAGLVHAHGAAGAAAILDMSRHATLALALGIEASRGSVAIAREAQRRQAA